ncbi:MAG: hypothetical protein WBA74_10350 [Cyclobacteriaceae bacterium]
MHKKIKFQRKRGFKIMELVKIIMGLISYQIDEIKGKLEIESKGNEIAYMQGKLKGLRMYKAAMLENLVLFSFWEPIKEIDVSKIKNSILKLLVSQIEESKNDERWISIKKIVESEVVIMKDYLFLDAKDSRSLFLTHGKRDGLFLSSEVMQDVISQYEYRIKKEKERKEDEPLLEWMKYYDNSEETIDAVEFFKDLFIEDVEEVIND